MAANAEAAELDRANARIEELTAALAAKDEALRLADECCHASVETRSETRVEVRKALSLQPHASLVRAIKADALMALAARTDGVIAASNAVRQWILEEADRIEKGEV